MSRTTAEVYPEKLGFADFRGVPLIFGVFIGLCILGVYSRGELIWGCFNPKIPLNNHKDHRASYALSTDYSIRVSNFVIRLHYTHDISEGVLANEAMIPKQDATPFTKKTPESHKEE